MEIGDIVILKEPLLPPTKWKLVRVIEKYPDNKGHTRRYDIKSGSEVIHRPAKRLVPLLKEEEETGTQPGTNDEEPALRRSKRKPARTTSMLTRVLLWWLTLTTIAEALVIQTLTPGTHVHRLDTAHAKAFDLEFSITTSINITADELAINGQV